MKSAVPILVFEALPSEKSLDHLSLRDAPSSECDYNSKESTQGPYDELMSETMGSGGRRSS
jgi:hypothetical protein